MERRVLLKHYLQNGMSKTAAARALGITRQTVHRWTAEESWETELGVRVPRYGPRPSVPTKLDSYHAIIRTRLEEYPELSSVRLLDEVRAAGYTGSYTQLKEFVRSVRPRPPQAAVERFETAPGHQAQVDFAEFTFPWGKRYALVVVLGYSRMLWFRFYERQDMRTLLSGLEEAFRFFGGVTREILFDQMKAVITRDLRLQGGQLVKNEEFLRFASHWSFIPRACRPYRAQTKGKVERPISYIRRSFVYAREFAGDEDLNAQAAQWLEKTANARVHRTIGEQPVVRFHRDEQSVLQPLATEPYRSLVLLPSKEPKKRRTVNFPAVTVERRPLSHYARAAGGVG